MTLAIWSPSFLVGSKLNTPTGAKRSPKQPDGDEGAGTPKSITYNTSKEYWNHAGASLLSGTLTGALSGAASVLGANGVNVNADGSKTVINNAFGFGSGGGANFSSGLLNGLARGSINTVGQYAIANGVGALEHHWNTGSFEGYKGEKFNLGSAMADIVGEGIGSGIRAGGGSDFLSQMGTLVARKAAYFAGNTAQYFASGGSGEGFMRMKGIDMIGGLSASFGVRNVASGAYSQILGLSLTGDGLDIGWGPTHRSSDITLGVEMGQDIAEANEARERARLRKIAEEKERSEEEERAKREAMVGVLTGGARTEDEFDDSFDDILPEGDDKGDPKPAVVEKKAEDFSKIYDKKFTGKIAELMKRVDAGGTLSDQEKSMMKQFETAFDAFSDTLDKVDNSPLVKAHQAQIQAEKNELVNDKAYVDSLQKQKSGMSAIQWLFSPVRGQLNDAQKALAEREARIDNLSTTLDQTRRNDTFVELQVQLFNEKRGYKPGNANYLDPNLIKTQYRMESAMSSSLLNNDPMQVNNGLTDNRYPNGDWSDEKLQFGLQKEVLPGWQTSITAGIGWLEIKKNNFLDQAAYLRTGDFQKTGVTDWMHALQGYNSNYDKKVGCLCHAEWYMNEIWNKYQSVNRAANK